MLIETINNMTQFWLKLCRWMQQVSYIYLIPSTNEVLSAD